mgnify:CR=1 FL=1
MRKYGLYLLIAMSLMTGLSEKRYSDGGYSGGDDTGER